MKAEQLMAGKQLLVSKSLINPFGTSIIDQNVRESIKATFHSTIFDIPMRPVREDQRHRRR